MITASRSSGEVEQGFQRRAALVIGLIGLSLQDLHE